ncbi:hypothetical protein ABER02_16645 [Rossellomorea marisflavi]|uniref:hypothetical protein n=1 Tax=Rossellomorea marisflavi TaxID=189381 RepID=UPI003D2CC310
MGTNDSSSRFKLGKLLYGEWLVPIVDYFRTLNKKEFYYEWVTPLLISFVIALSYEYLGNVEAALSKLRDILPDTLAILIGFTITCVTVLVASSGKTIDLLKNKKTDNRKIGKKTVSMYQWLLILFIYVLISQISLLIFIFFSSYLLSVYKTLYIIYATLFIMTFLLLHILLLLIRNTTNFYFIFFIDTNIGEDGE